ncbi:hypothetical protein ACHAPI_010035 [Fusarium lateritium]
MNNRITRGDQIVNELTVSHMDNTSLGEIGIGDNMLSLHQNLVKATMRIRGLEQQRETEKLSCKVSIDKLNKFMDFLRIWDTECNEMNQIIDDLRLHIGQLSIDVSTNA